MRASRKESFIPITITIETEGEAIAMYHRLNTGYQTICQPENSTVDRDREVLREHQSTMYQAFCDQYKVR